MTFRDLRKSHKLTQQQVADLMGIARPAVSEIEAGRRNLRCAELATLAEALDLTPATVVDVMNSFRSAA